MSGRMIGETTELPDKDLVEAKEDRERIMAHWGKFLDQCRAWSEHI